MRLNSGLTLAQILVQYELTLIMTLVGVWDVGQQSIDAVRCISLE